MLTLKDLTLEITNQCPQRCVHCSSEACFEAKELLSQTEVASIVRQALGLGLETISISGGEPLLHPQLLPILQATCETGVRVKLYTCGIIGTPQRPASVGTKMFQEIKQAGVNTVVFSLHGTGKLCDEITGIGGSQEYILSSVRNAIEAGFSPEVHFVPMANNLESFPSVAEQAYQAGVRKIHLLRLVPQGKATVAMVANLEQMQEFLKQVDELQSQYPDLSIRQGHPLSIVNCHRESLCSAGMSKLVVTASGKVVPCEAFKFLIRREDCPDIRTKSLKEIWYYDELLTKLRVLNIIQEERQWVNLLEKAE